ncbi:hypothetical protein ENUP19_0241G0036 [Entamoeba nuttalli]|uniref:Structural maintenance of chromosomes protein 5 n=2 Tax=Entamoeba nuttalli TaxID=412467 RepID=K2H6P8_ENTNP|nr:RecF/RecN/SMC domain containing protein [Entamoeba nuttalli P19]EKE38134.1 RecF/RecN/SMC domain containing protein [Entamoeba nuttalli P19]|eukprot:XP_008859526.1 RecF/RecN/SMC domain containing protein [Entamoeba nuttalli P19]
MKRQNTTQTTQYHRGSIIRIKMERFLTYDSVEVFPGKGLNVIIGPNGAGKSSIVCAIALGLGTAPKVLGRSKDLKDFVKIGEEDAVIEVELFNGITRANNLVIRRQFNLNNQSNWFINGRTASHKEVLQKCNEYCIMIDNLCQFLPQDRVSAFSSLNPAELLRETEKATGTSDLEEKHDQIIKAQGSIGELRKKSAQQEKGIQELKYRVDGLEKSVHEKHEQERRQTRLNQLKMKKPWAEFEEVRKKAVGLREEKQQLQQKLDSLHQEMTPVAMEFNKIKNKIESEDKKVNDTKTICDKNEREIIIAETQKEKLEQELSNKKKEVELAKKRKEEKNRNINELKNELIIIEQKLKDIPNLDELEKRANEEQVQLKGFREQINEKQDKDASLDTQLREMNGKILQLNRDLAKLNDLKQNKLRKIFDNDAAVMQAYSWLQEHKGLFEEEVYGPICVELNVSKDEYTNFVEMCVPISVLKGFVVTNKKDENTLISKLVEEKGTQIQVFKREHDNTGTQATQLRLHSEYGVLTTMDKAVIGPDAVLKVVEDMCQLSKKFICNKETEQYIERLPPGTYFTPSSVINKVKSRYSDAVSDKVNSIRKARFLSTAIDTNQKLKLEQEIKKITQDLEVVKRNIEENRKEIKMLEEKKHEIGRGIEEFNRAKGERDKLIRSKRSKENNLKLFENDEDLDKKIGDLQKGIKKIQTKINEQMLKMGDLLKRFIEAKMETNPVSCIVRILRIKQMKCKNQLNEFKRRLSELENEFRRIGQLYDDAKNEAVKKRKEAEAVCIITNELNDIFQQLPDEVSAIEEEIENEESKLKYRQNVEENVEELYQQAKNELSKKLEDAQIVNEEIKNAEEVMTGIKDEWLNKVKEVIEHINESFSVYMNQINCRGSVELDEKEEYDKYGIIIKTMFRKEGSLQQLNAHTQSGGERSVATMLYLLSLQEQTFCPFRLVDEINQGMDPLNERMIFSQIVKAVNKENAQQYFLVTPKLLSDLPFGENMTVLCVMNGKIDPAPYSFDAIIDSMK